MLHYIDVTLEDFLTESQCEICN